MCGCYRLSATRTGGCSRRSVDTAAGRRWDKGVEVVGVSQTYLAESKPAAVGCAVDAAHRPCARPRPRHRLDTDLTRGLRTPRERPWLAARRIRAMAGKGTRRRTRRTPAVNNNSFIQRRAGGCWSSCAACSGYGIFEATKRGVHSRPRCRCRRRRCRTVDPAQGDRDAWTAVHKAAARALFHGEDGGERLGRSAAVRRIFGDGTGRTRCRRLVAQGVNPGHRHQIAVTAPGRPTPQRTARRLGRTVDRHRQTGQRHLSLRTGPLPTRPLGGETTYAPAHGSTGDRGKQRGRATP